MNILRLRCCHDRFSWKRHLYDSALLSNTWLFHMRVGCRAVQTRLSWITPRWEAICTGLLTTILRRQVQDRLSLVAAVQQIQTDVSSWQNIALRYIFCVVVTGCSTCSVEVACLAPCSLIAAHEDQTSHGLFWSKPWSLCILFFNLRFCCFYVSIILYDPFLYIIELLVSSRFLLMLVASFSFTVGSWSYIYIGSYVFTPQVVMIIELDDGKILTGKPYIWW